MHSDRLDWNEFLFTIDAPPGLQGVSKDVPGSSKIEQTLKKPFKIDKKTCFVTVYSILCNLGHQTFKFEFSEC